MKSRDQLPPRLGTTQEGIVYSRQNGHCPTATTNSRLDDYARVSHQSSGVSSILMINTDGGAYLPPPPPPPPRLTCPETCHPLLQTTGLLPPAAEWNPVPHANAAAELLSDASCSVTSGSVSNIGGGPSNRTSAGTNSAVTSNSSSTAHKKTQYHKTKLCPWHRDGKCFMGASCNYAHSREELKPKPDLSKTKLCPEVVRNKRCDRPGCRFAHDFVELRATSTFFKTRICKFWQRGYCPAGDECRHAHGKEDIRQDLTSTGGISMTGSSEEDLNSLENTSQRQRIDSTGERLEMYPPKEMIPPTASALPSPSFLSTSACTPLARVKQDISGAVKDLGFLPTDAAFSVLQENAGRNKEPFAELLSQPIESKSLEGPLPESGGAPDVNVLLGNPLIQTCAELMSSDGQVDEQAKQIMFVLLKTWVAEEVDRQWASKQQSPPHLNTTAPPSTTTLSPSTPTSVVDERQFLPSNVLQSLSGASPVNGTAESSPFLAEAMQWVLNSPMNSNKQTDAPPPSTLLLQTLAEIRTVFDRAAGGGASSPLNANLPCSRDEASVNE